MLNLSHCFQKDDPVVNIFALPCMLCTSYHKFCTHNVSDFLIKRKTTIIHCRTYTKICKYHAN